MAGKKSFEIRFPETEAGWLELGKRVTESKKATRGAQPKLAEVRRAQGGMRRHHDQADELRRKAREAETKEQAAKREMMDLLRRRGRNIRSLFRDSAEAKAALLAEGYDVIESE